MKNTVIFSFFSGAGFLDFGFEDAGYSIEFVNEIVPSFMEAYVYNRRRAGRPDPAYGYNLQSIEDFDTDKENPLSDSLRKAREAGKKVGFIGGPPCPDFSIAGKQAGRNGKNGQLSQIYVNIIKRYQPDFFLFENVKGLISTSKHRQYFDDLRSQLGEDFAMDYRLVNALQYGAPQDRERVIWVGAKLDGDMFSNALSWNSTDPKEIKLLSWPDRDAFEEDSVRSCPKGIPAGLTVEYWFEKNDVVNHPNAKDHFIPRGGLPKMEEVAEGDTSKKSYKRLHRWRYSPTVAYGNNEVHLHPYKARRLSVAEALALQSLPKTYVLPADMTLSDMFKTVGNGVPYLLAKGVAEMLIPVIEEIEGIESNGR